MKKSLFILISILLSLTQLSCSKKNEIERPSSNYLKIFDNAEVSTYIDSSKVYKYTDDTNLRIFYIIINHHNPIVMRENLPILSTKGVMIFNCEKEQMVAMGGAYYLKPFAFDEDLAFSDNYTGQWEPYVKNELTQMICNTSIERLEHWPENSPYILPLK